MPNAPSHPQNGVVHVHQPSYHVQWWFLVMSGNCPAVSMEESMWWCGLNSSDVQEEHFPCWTSSDVQEEHFPWSNKRACVTVGECWEHLEKSKFSSSWQSCCYLSGCLWCELENGRMPNVLSQPREGNRQLCAPCLSDLVPVLPCSLHGRNFMWWRGLNSKWCPANHHVISRVSSITLVSR